MSCLHGQQGFAKLRAKQIFRRRCLVESKATTRRNLLRLSGPAALSLCWLSNVKQADAAAWEFLTNIGDLDPAKKKIQQEYDRYAETYDDLDAGGVADALGFDELRTKLLSRANGQVVEIASGTGLNLKHYRWGCGGGVRQLISTDISNGMLGVAKRRVASDEYLRRQDITFMQADATALPLPDARADYIVDTFSLCVIPDPLGALKEMARVVKDESEGGRVLLLEHAKSDNPLLGAYQDITAEAVASTAKGCYWNQDMPKLLAQAGLVPVTLERHVAGTIVLIEAVKASSGNSNRSSVILNQLPSIPDTPLKQCAVEDA